MSTGSIQTVGVIGEGKMGTGLFYYLLDFPLRMVWICSRGADPEKIRKTFERKRNRSLEAGIITAAQSDRWQQTVISGDIRDLHDADLVIEAIPEDLSLKKALFGNLAKVVKPGSILASNSSSINPSMLLPGPEWETAMIGLHFFYPVQLKNIVEFIYTDRTSNVVKQQTAAFLTLINRHYLPLPEKRSFVLNKIFLDIQNEAFLLVNSGYLSIRQADFLVKEHLAPSGIFDFMDSVGLDTMLAAVLNYTCDYPHRDYYEPLIAKLQELVDQGKLGRKSGEGFYNYNVPSMPEGDPSDQAMIISHLQQAYRSSAKRFISGSGLPIADMNQAIREYLGTEKGPFE
jgi:3-hydroxybutyryl-CoA dehydrogenase